MHYFLWLSLFVCSGVLAQEQDWHFSANAGASYFRHDNKGVGRSEHFRPVLEFGIVREISPDWRLQTSIEWMRDNGDDIAPGNFINWHIGEVDYRLSDNFALTFYGGMARYYREQPSWGYSKGVGCKYRVSDRWLFSADFADAVVDISDSVPQSAPLHNRDFMRWFSVTLNYQF